MLETISTKRKLRMTTESGLKVEADVTNNPNGIVIESGSVYEASGVFRATFHRNDGSSWHYDFNSQSTREQREESMAAVEDFIAEASVEEINS